MDALSKLSQLETTIANGVETFLEVGSALKQIRDEGLYRNGYHSFEEYVKERWGWNRSYAYRLIKVSEVESVLPIGDTQKPKTESQFREVAKAPPEKQAEVVEAAQAKAELENREPTAKDYREAREELLSPPEPELEYEDADDDPSGSLVEPVYDEDVIEAFAATDYRLGTLRRLLDDLSETETEIVKAWLNT